MSRVIRSGDASGVMNSSLQADSVQSETGQNTPLVRMKTVSFYSNLAEVKEIVHDEKISHTEWMDRYGLNFNEDTWIWYRPAQVGRTWNIQWVNTYGKERLPHWRWRCHWCDFPTPHSSGCPTETCQVMDELIH